MSDFEFGISGFLSQLLPSLWGFEVLESPEESDHGDDKKTLLRSRIFQARKREASSAQSLQTSKGRGEQNTQAIR
ncbi:hypothetical protein QQF64_022730 [Cirrhinus molitorella]|uniref:Uncharacterized protein n=1 Tax=Cirrhinus molitorella TaxID=172907 RepID=A0ABR3L373_9TELE